VVRAAGDLRELGWLSDQGRLSDAGAAARHDVEQRTDEAAAGPWGALGDAGTGRLAELLAPLATAVLHAGYYRWPNPIGAPAPA
jgi:predicted phage gp36 major capsid-like protein